MALDHILKQRLIWIIVVLAIIYGLYRALTLAWVGDDAFISFRYAQNLSEGHGLVFNPGERVEGYTNFLWTIILAAGMYVGLEPITFSWILGIAAYLLTALALIYLSCKLKDQYGSKAGMAIPAAAIAILVQHDYHLYATSGLETSLTAALVTLGFVGLVLADTKRKFLLAGHLLIMAALCRPDSIMFYIMAIPYLLMLEKNRKINLLYYLIPLLAIFLPYWIARYMYYGYPFPNTYYAKSAYLPYYSQGIAYLVLYLRTYYILIFLPVAMVAAASVFLPRLLKSKKISNRLDRVWILGILFIIPYLFYVVRTGGDFMFARFFIPIMPLCFLFLETVIMALGRWQSLQIGLALVILAAVFLRWNQFDYPEKRINEITDESSFYPKWRIEQAQINGANIKKYLANLDVKVGFYGSQAMTIYYSGLPYAIECHSGLTDTYLAHLPLPQRGRPGHEKMAPHDYLLKREVNFIVKRTDLLPEDKTRLLFLDKTILHIVVYKNSIMEKLKKYPEVHFVDFAASLDRYIATMDYLPDSQLIDDLEYFKMYYFNVNNDPSRLQPFLKRLKNAGQGE